MYPTRPRLLHSGLTIGFIVVDPAVVPKCRAGDHVNNHQDDQDDDVNYRNLPPTLFQASQHPSFARVTGVAQLSLVVAPVRTISIGSRQPPSGIPQSLVHISETALCWGFAAARLNWSELSEIEQISRLSDTPNFPPHLPAHLGIPNTRADLLPVGLARHALLQPPGVIAQLVLQVSPVRHGMTGSLVGDGVGEDDEADEDGDYDEHGPEVGVHEEGVAVAGAGETGEGDDHDGDADDDERPLEELEAVGVVCAAAEPDAAAQDGDGEEEG